MGIGNPHCVIEVDNIDTAPVAALGKAIATHERFPEGVNVGFMQIVDRNRVKLRVYERGVGETQACGSGACAAAVIGMRQGKLDDHVNVELPGGHLSIRWEEGQQVRMTGSAEHVYDGYLKL